MKKFLILIALFCLAVSARAEALPPQVAFSDEPVSLYAKPDADSKSQEVRLPEKGANVESAVRKDGGLWYKVKVDGKTGWIESEGVYLKMGPKSKAAASIYKSYAKARAKFLGGKGPGSGWEKYEDAEWAQVVVETWGSKDAVLQTISNRRGSGKVGDLYFAARRSAVSKQFLGFPAVGMTEKALRAKMGHSTGRTASVLRYEIPNEDLTLSFTLEDDVVTKAELAPLTPEDDDEANVVELRRFLGED